MPSYFGKSHPTFAIELADCTVQGNFAYKPKLFQFIFESPNISAAICDKSPLP